LPLDPPISGIMAEIFLQHFKDIYVKHLLDTKSLAFYRRYIDDILIIYDATRIPLSTGILYGCLQRVTIPEAVIIQFVLLKMSKALLETC